MSIGVVIMGRPEREENVERMLGLLPGVLAAIDTPPAGSPPNAWRGARVAWEMAAGLNGMWSLVLQDDLILCDDFMARAWDCLQHLPLTVGASLFHVTRSRLDQWRPARPWVKSNYISWGQALALPTVLVPDFLGWVDRNVAPDYPHDDVRYTLFAMHYGFHVYMPRPCLVEHLGLPSLMGNNPPIPRRACWFEKSIPPGIDWRHPISAVRLPSRSLSSYGDRWRAKHG